MSLPRKSFFEGEKGINLSDWLPPATRYSRETIPILLLAASDSTGDRRSISAFLRLILAKLVETT